MFLYSRTWVLELFGAIGTPLCHQKKTTFAFLQHSEEHRETINKVGGDPGDMVKVLFATCENNGSIC